MKTGPLAMLSIFERLTGSDQPLYAQVGFCAEWLLDNICKILNITCIKILKKNYILLYLINSCR